MRFIVDDPESKELPGGVLRHMKTVRLRVGESFVLCDGKGRDFNCVVSGVTKSGAEYDIVSVTNSESEPPYLLSVYMAYAKGERLEYAVQKCTELGAREFILFPSENCVALPDEKSIPNKIARLQSIAHAASEQSGRGTVPEIRAAKSFKEAILQAAAARLPLFPFEREREKTLLTALSGVSAETISVMTGSEGGFTDEEAEYAVKSGMVSVTLGRRILRCDTAPIAVAAIIAAVYN